jgi:hypothetical protein
MHRKVAIANEGAGHAVVVHLVALNPPVILGPDQLDTDQLRGNVRRCGGLHAVDIGRVEPLDGTQKIPVPTERH